MRCPACGTHDTRQVHRHTAAIAAQHFVPQERDPRRHAKLRTHLADLWGQDHVDVQVCNGCDFGFAVPWVGGDERFYALAHKGEPHYPEDRWEFGETLAALREWDRPVRLAEVGAGHGAFLDRLATLGHPNEILAADFDEGAVRTLRSKGYAALRGSLADLAAQGGNFDVVCMFQTLEHMAQIDVVFQTLHEILSPRGSVFLSVPNGKATAFQEEVTGYWDMPPNHVGRWTPSSLHLAAERHGFAAEVVTQPVHIVETTWQLAVSSVNGRTYAAGTIESRINALTSRSLRGALKRVVATSRIPRLAARRGQFQPLSCWAHLRASP